jgi:hypothetical protein
VPAPTSTPAFSINTVGGPPNPTAVSAESSYIASQASVISFGGGGSYVQPAAVPLVTSTFVTEGLTYTVAIPANGATTVVPVSAGGSVVSQTIVVPTSIAFGPGPVVSAASSVPSAPFSTGPGPVASSTYAAWSSVYTPPAYSPPASSQPAYSPAVPHPGTSSQTPATTYTQVGATTKSTILSQPASSLTSAQSSLTLATSTKVPTLSVQTTLATRTSTPTSTPSASVGPVPPAKGAASTFKFDHALLLVVFGMVFAFVL